jgi:hypothetical protein
LLLWPSKLLPLLLPVLCRMLYDMRRGGVTSRRRTAVSSAWLLSVVLVVLVLLLASPAVPDCVASGRCSPPAAAWRVSLRHTRQCSRHSIAHNRSVINC